MSESVVRRLRAVVRELAALSAHVDDAERIDRIRLLTELESAAAAARAQEVARFAASQRAEQRASGTPADRGGRGVAAQVALAMRCSPARAQKYVGWAAVLTAELPATFGALQRGAISEWRALIVARETIWLTREDRARVDAELAGVLESLGDRRLEAATRTMAYRADPDGYLARTKAAEQDRRVTLRPAPDCMARLTALLPVAQGVAAYAALSRAADTDRAAAGGTKRARGRGQVMADTLVERLTGQAAAEQVPVEVGLVMTDRALLAAPGTPGSEEPGLVDGHHPVPAGIARELISDPDTRVWLRRLFTSPTTGHLAAMESRRREFTPAQRAFLTLRDQICRTPWCDAPIRHADHITPADSGGRTEIDNGQGLCEACNYAKQAPGWRTDPLRSRDGSFEVDITTPTGHTYRSRAPDPPRAA